MGYCMVFISQRILPERNDVRLNKKSATLFRMALLLFFKYLITSEDLLF